jgi:hypothetical protein
MEVGFKAAEYADEIGRNVYHFDDRRQQVFHDAVQATVSRICRNIEHRNNFEGAARE